MKTTVKTPHLLPTQIAGLVTALILSGGCTGRKPPYISTNARLPEPCSVVSDSLVRELVGATNGKRVDHDSTSAICAWEGPTTDDKRQRTGHLTTTVSIQERILTDSNDPQGEAKAAYRAAFINNTCTVFKTLADESCWYVDEDNKLVLAFRKKYTVASVSLRASNSPALESANIQRTVKRIADEVLQKI